MPKVVAMTYPLWVPQMRYASSIAASVLLAACVASAQSTSPVQSSTTGYSSSQAGLQEYAELTLPNAPAPLASSSGSGGSAAGQYGNGGGYKGGGDHGLWHRFTFEAGGGASAPAGDKADITWGGGFLIGGGFNINRNLAAFVEYQFLDNKVPGAVIAESGAQGGHYHIWSFTVDPVYDFFPKASNDVYAVGGGGFYRKVMDFTNPTQSCGFFYYYYSCGTSNQVVGSISSNQGGFNIGGGYQHRFGGMYGQSRMRVFAEVRYLEVLSPAIRSQSANGLSPVSISADTKLLPITLGIRW